MIQACCFNLYTVHDRLRHIRRARSNVIITLGMLAYDVILTLNLYVADLEYELLSLISVLFQ